MGAKKEGGRESEEDVKIDEARAKLKAKLAEEIRAWVRVKLEDPAVSRSTFLEPHAFQTHAFYTAFRRKMLNANTWEPMQEMLASERIYPRAN